jgi:hypothetical protein
MKEKSMLTLNLGAYYATYLTGFNVYILSHFKGFI